MKHLRFLAIATLMTTFAAGGENVRIDVRTFKLDNGLQVIFAPRHDTPIVHSLVRYRVGSANESAGLTGMSHMLEHMMFKGTKELQTANYDLEQGPMQEQDQMFAQVLDIRTRAMMNRPVENSDEEIQKLLLKIKGLNVTLKIVTVQNDVDVATTQAGFSRLGADTSFDRTHYMEFFPSNCLEAWAYFESARMKEPVFREFYSERDVILEERRQTTETQPDGVMIERFLAAAFTAHSYRWDVIGWRSDIENYTRRDVAEYHRLYYAPNNAILVLVGDFQPGPAEALIRKYFGKIPAQDIPRPVAMTLEPPQLGEKRLTVTFEGTPRLMIGFHRPGFGHPDYPVLEMIDALLSRGRSSVLYKELTLGGKAAEFSTGIWEMKRYPGLFTVSAVAEKDVELSDLEKIILDALEKLKAQEVTARVLETARAKVTGQMLQRLNDREELAVVLAEGLDFSDDPFAFNDYLKLIQNVTAQDIQRVARQYFARENRTVAWMMPAAPEKEVKK
ncbi:MAG: insulinase family protein [Acidobacteria bacterium]|nr:insulinase family protein [Acidobacteriota bacterium]